MIQNKKSSKKPKTRIIIPELIKKVRVPQEISNPLLLEDNKQNQCINSSINKQSYIVKEYESLYQQNNSETESNPDKKADNQKSPKKQQKQIRTNQSTYRCVDGDSLNEQSSIQSISELIMKKKNNGLHRLEEMIVSEKMFINPDRWSEYLNRAMGDEQFQKALNVFLYSYFIQNYN